MKRVLGVVRLGAEGTVRMRRKGEREVVKDSRARRASCRRVVEVGEGIVVVGVGKGSGCFNGDLNRPWLLYSGSIRNRGLLNLSMFVMHQCSIETPIPNAMQRMQFMPK